VPLALSAVALVDGRRRFLAWALGAVGVAATLAALGPHAPFAAGVRAIVPGAGHLRYPSKAMLVPAFACAMLCGHGLEATRRLSRARAQAGIVAAAGAAALLAAAVLFGPGAAWAAGVGLFEAREGAQADALPFALRFAALALLALVAAATLFDGARASSRLPRGSLLAACAVAELWLAHHDLHPTAPPAALSVRPPVLSAVDASGRGRVYGYDYALVEGSAARRLGRASAYVVAQPPAGFDPRLLAAFAARVYPVPPVSATWGVEGSYDIDQAGLGRAAQRSLGRAARLS